MTKIEETALDEKDLTSVTNNFLHSLFRHCTVSLNDTTITQATDFYIYRSLLETILTNGNDTATTHLTNAMWILDDGNLAASAADSTNKGFMIR